MQEEMRQIMRIHVVPGVDAASAAADLMQTGMVAVDDIGRESYQGVFEEILEELGHMADVLDLREQRVETPLGPVFILREPSMWSASRARKAVFADRGGPRT
jgi:hypothetical protein